MNLILFDRGELSSPLKRSDPRARHVLEVLRRAEGDTFDVGLINGPRGRGRVEKISPETVSLSFAWSEEPPPPDPIILLVGLPRPQTARKLLSETAALGVTALHFFTAEKAESGYARSTLWSDGEWRRHLIAGAEQAFDTRLPVVTHNKTLAAAIAQLPSGATRLALDNYEATQPLSRCQPAAGSPVALAFGPERGWAAAERNFLRTQNFSLVHLGPRVLRLETVAVAALTLVKAQLGLF